MWLFKVFVVTYLTAVCAAQDAPDATFVPTSAPPSTAQEEVITTVYVPPVPVLQQSSGWLEVFPSEKVEFSCTISGSSDWTFTWYRNGEKIDAEANLSFSGDGSVLTITAATNSGEYTCKGLHKTKGVMTQSSNSLQLKVHANRPKPKLSRSSNYQEMFPGESITFECLVDVSVGWEYLWYRNGQEIPAANDNKYKLAVTHSGNGQYHCKAKRGKDQFYTEASEPTLLRVSDPPTPTLKLLSTWSDVFEGELVEFSCEVSGSGWTYTWYRNQAKLQEDDNTIMDEERLELNITSVTKARQEDYTCKAHLISRGVSSGSSNSINVKVYDDVPTATLSKDGFNPMYVGETVNFTCKVTVSSGWTYQWYKDENRLLDTSETISIFLGLSDKGGYSCRGIRGGKTATNRSEIKQQDVLEIPVPSLKNVTQWLDVFPTERVELRCGMQSGSGWTYTWYKDTLEVQADNTVLFDSNRATLSINSAVSGKHNGLYECKGHLQDRTVKSISSSPLHLMVYDKKPTVTLTQDPEYKLMYLGESVSFSCYINVSSGWEYQWFKDSSPLAASESKHSISPVKVTSRGSYACRVKRGSNHIFTTDLSPVIRLEVEDKKPKPFMTQKPAADKLYTGEPVSFECKVGTSSGWTYYWYKDGVPFRNDSSSFQIDHATSLNSGNYECKAIRNRTMLNTEPSDRRTLRISEIPVPSLKNVTQWLDVFPTEGVKFRCEMPTSSDWTYTWYKDTKEVQADANMFDDKDRTTLTIHSASALHRGKYSCSGKLKVRSVKTSLSSDLRLDVYDTKPRVTLMQNPEHSLMHTEDKVTFSCHINVSSGWEFQWYKDDSKLHTSGINHSISSVTRSNAGLYKCEAKRGTEMVFNTASQTLKLNIEERPQASITLLTGWGEAFSTDSLVFQCEVTDGQYRDWNYTWFREDQPINTPLSAKYIVTPKDDPDQSSYKCQGIRPGRPAYSKKSISHKTKNLLLKRRVLLSITGVLFFGIVVVFLGCIILRVIRKPADDDEKPEEANLFLTMAQLKDCADAPCPLVEYITDADVNPPSKEGDENGTICSETTPLPIASPEDKAVTTDNHDTTENNGGLVSFKQ